MTPLRFAASGLACTMLFSVSAPAAAQASCDRTCLIGVAEKYLAAMLTHDPKNAPLAANVRYTENAVEMKLPDGLWRTASKLGPYRLYVADPQWNTIGFFSSMEESGSSLVLATRLKVENGLITEIESVASRHSPEKANGGLAGLPEALKGPPRRQFTDVVPPAQRLGREKLIAIADQYWKALEANDGKDPTPWADDCYRIENGHPTTLVPVQPGKEPTNMNMSCKEAFQTGYYREDTRVRDRRYLAVDEERNLVYQTVFIDHDGTIRHYNLNNGKPRDVTRTAPYSWMPQAVIQITPDGKISQIEATPLLVQYGTRPGWTNYEKRPSDVQDGPTPW